MSFTQDSNNIIITDEGSAASPVTLDTLVSEYGGVVIKTEDNTYFISKNVHLDGTTFCNFTLANITVDTRNHYIAFRVSNDAVLQLGEIDADGNTFNGVSFQLINCSANVWSQSGQSGDLLFYGSRISCVPNSPSQDFVFWRAYRNDSHLNDLIDCIIEGFSGTGRLQGLRLRNTQIVNATLGFPPPLTVKAPTREIDALIVRRCNAFFYWNVVLSESITVRNLKERDNNNTALYMADFTGATATFINPDFENPTINFTNQEPSNNNANVFEFYSYNAVAVLDSDSSVQEDVKLAFYRSNGDEEYSEVSDSGGVFTEALLLKQFYNSSTPTTRTPHVLRLRKLNLIYVEQPVNAVTPVVNQFRLRVNNRIDNAIAHAGITFDFANKTILIDDDNNFQTLYDSYQYHLQLTANMQYSEVLALVGESFNLDDYDLTVDDATYTGDLITTGNLTLSNGGKITGSYTDQNGTVAPSVQLTISVNQTGCDVVILEAGTSTVLASVDEQAGNDFIYVYSGTQTVDVGVVKQGFVVNYTYGFALNGLSTTLPVKLIADRNYI